MKFITYILFFLFSLSILGKGNLLAYIKKIKSPIELTANGIDDETREVGDDENKERSEKEELKEKDSFFIETNFNNSLYLSFACNKHILNFYKLLFKSHFNEVVTPPPELAR